MTTPDTTIVPASKPARQARRATEFDAIGEACRAWLRANPTEPDADRDVIRNARDIADATADLIRAATDATRLDRARRTVLALDSAHVAAMLSAQLGAYNITVTR